jgi:hypothetical protein
MLIIRHGQKVVKIKKKCTKKNQTQELDKQIKLNPLVPSGVVILSYMCNVVTIIFLDHDNQELCGRK